MLNLLNNMSKEQTSITVVALDGKEITITYYDDETFEIKEEE